MGFDFHLSRYLTKATRALLVPSLLFASACVKDGTPVKIKKYNAGGISCGKAVEYRDIGTDKKYFDCGEDGTLDLFFYGGTKQDARVDILDKKVKRDTGLFVGDTVLMRGSEEANRLQAEFDAVKAEYAKQEAAKQKGAR
jgi:hypothetical protein